MWLQCCLLITLLLGVLGVNEESSQNKASSDFKISKRELETSYQVFDIDDGRQLSDGDGSGGDDVRIRVSIFETYFDIFHLISVLYL